MSESDTEPFQLEFFKEKHFRRAICTSCGKYFWTQDAGRTTCGDPPCDAYSFIGKPGGKRNFTIEEVREAFIAYFSKDHSVIKPYPVVPRWRSDVLLVNASIYDFQPHVTSGIVPPPGNPLVMSQPSIRMNDLDLVGVSGRHLTSFEMLCHDTFNRHGREIYWKEGTVSRCYNFFTEIMGLDGTDITFKEKPWSGGGNAGNALEVFSRGLEVATLVFMDLKEDSEGDVQVDGKRYSPMEMKIVDTGYGLERISWLTQGSPTVYDSTYSDVIDFILQGTGVTKEQRREMGIITQIHSKDPDKSPGEIEAEVKRATQESDILDWEVVDKIRHAYIIGDHARSILHMSRDYVIPSNVKVGYLMRMLLRRSFRAMESIGFQGEFTDIIEMQFEKLQSIVADYPRSFVKEIIDDEREKYRKSLESGREIVLRILKKKGTVDFSDMQLLYDSHGLVPEFVSQIAKKQGVTITIPMNFHETIVNRHDLQLKDEGQKPREKSFLELETRALYYDDPKMMEFTAIVLGSSGNLIVPNQTCFYATGGGQPHDTGYFKLGNKKIQVLDVYRQGNAIIHTLSDPIPKGTRLQGFVDVKRRRQLMIHHSATHLLLGTLRKILGDQVWQAGVQKGVESSRLDITYNKPISQEQISDIENLLLKEVSEDHKIFVRHMDWNLAIGKYGFRLFEGGAPLNKKLRIVQIEGIDVEGCGGTHVSSTSEIGFVKILSVENIQESIYRFIFAAGPAALKKVQENWERMNAIRSSLRATEDTVGRVQKMVEELINLRKKVEAITKEIVQERILQARKERILDLDVDIIHLQGDDQVKVAIPICLSKRSMSIIYAENSITFVSTDKEAIARVFQEKTGKKPESKGSVLTVSTNMLK